MGYDLRSKGYINARSWIYITHARRGAYACSLVHLFHSCRTCMSRSHACISTQVSHTVPAICSVPACALKYAYSYIFLVFHGANYTMDQWLKASCTFYWPGPVFCFWHNTSDDWCGLIQLRKSCHITTGPHDLSVILTGLQPPSLTFQIASLYMLGLLNPRLIFLFYGGFSVYLLFLYLFHGAAYNCILWLEGRDLFLDFTSRCFKVTHMFSIQR